MIQPARLKATALHATHRRMGAKMVGFGGWDMPLQYSGIFEEHRAVRSAVGLFDVSHMGERWVARRPARSLLHKVANDHYFLCVNASNQQKDYEHIAGVRRFRATVRLTSDRYTQLAIQGPRAQDTLQRLTDLGSGRWLIITLSTRTWQESGGIARTGYTGEDGFEIYFAAGLRLESGMALYGHEIHSSITPFEAGLG